MTLHALVTGTAIFLSVFKLPYHLPAPMIHRRWCRINTGLWTTMWPSRRPSGAGVGRDEIKGENRWEMAEPIWQELAAWAQRTGPARATCKRGHENSWTLHSWDKLFPSLPTLLECGPQTQIPPVVRQATNDRQSPRIRKTLARSLSPPELFTQLTTKDVSSFPLAQNTTLSFLGNHDSPFLGNPSHFMSCKAPIHLWDVTQNLLFQENVLGPLKVETLSLWF